MLYWLIQAGMLVQGYFGLVWFQLLRFVGTIFMGPEDCVEQLQQGVTDFLANHGAHDVMRMFEPKYKVWRSDDLREGERPIDAEFDGPPVAFPPPRAVNPPARPVPIPGARTIPGMRRTRRLRLNHAVQAGARPILSRQGHRPRPNHHRPENRLNINSSLPGRGFRRPIRNRWPRWLFSG